MVGAESLEEGEKNWKTEAGDKKRAEETEQGKERNIAFSVYSCTSLPPWVGNLAFSTLFGTLTASVASSKQPSHAPSHRVTFLRDLPWCFS